MKQIIIGLFIMLLVACSGNDASGLYNYGKAKYTEAVNKGIAYKDSVDSTTLADYSSFDTYDSTFDASKYDSTKLNRYDRIDLSSKRTCKTISGTPVEFDVFYSGPTGMWQLGSINRNRNACEFYWVNTHN